MGKKTGKHNQNKHHEVHHPQGHEDDKHEEHQDDHEEDTQDANKRYDASREKLDSSRGPESKKGHDSGRDNQSLSQSKNNFDEDLAAEARENVTASSRKKKNVKRDEPTRDDSPLANFRGLDTPQPSSHRPLDGNARRIIPSPEELLMAESSDESERDIIEAARQMIPRSVRKEWGLTKKAWLGHTLWLALTAFLLWQWYLAAYDTPVPTTTLPSVNIEEIEERIRQQERERYKQKTPPKYECPDVSAYEGQVSTLNSKVRDLERALKNSGGRADEYQSKLDEFTKRMEQEKEITRRLQVELDEAKTLAAARAKENERYLDAEARRAKAEAEAKILAEQRRKIELEAKEARRREKAKAEGAKVETKTSGTGESKVTTTTETKTTHDTEHHTKTTTVHTRTETPNTQKDVEVKITTSELDIGENDAEDILYAETISLAKPLGTTEKTGVRMVQSKVESLLENRIERGLTKNQVFSFIETGLRKYFELALSHPQAPEFRSLHDTLSLLIPKLWTDKTIGDWFDWVHRDTLDSLLENTLTPRTLRRLKINGLVGRITVDLGLAGDKGTYTGSGLLIGIPWGHGTWAGVRRDHKKLAFGFVEGEYIITGYWQGFGFKPSEKMEITFPSGSVARGRINADWMNSYSTDNRIEYHGESRHTVSIQGSSVTLSNGDHYTGGMYMGVPNGQGTLLINGKRVVKGKWSNGKLPQVSSD